MLAPDRSALLVVDVQISLTPLVLDHQRMVWNISRLIRGATAMGIELHGTEQYPRGLKETVEALSGMLPPRHEKMDFSVGGVLPLMDQFRATERTQIVLAGIETHICILQSALDLLAGGYEVFVVADAVSARRTVDHEVALQRLRDEGAQLVTTETALFEWCRSASNPAFRTISDLARENSP
jgi:isochorismate hydrolase